MRGKDVSKNASPVKKPWSRSSENPIELVQREKLKHPRDSG
jgi:hypothetical protein